MAKYTKPSVAPLYAVAAVWVLWAMFLPMYRLLHFGILIILSVGVFFGAKRIWPGKTITVPDPPPQPENPEVAALLKQRDETLAEMRRLNGSIDDPVVSGHIDRLEESAEKIMSHVADHPEKLTQIRKFLNYYLPTTLKILQVYGAMDASGGAGENIDATKARVTEMLGRVVEAFDRQLDSLFSNEAMDISAEITVMEQMLAREGMTGPELEL